MDKFAKKGLIIDLVLIVTIFLVLCRGVDEVPFFPDEGQWIATSGVFEAYFSGDYDSPIWDINYWTVTQPPLTRYLIGFGRFLGGYSSEQLNTPWDFLNDDSTSSKEGSMPSPGLLFWSRIPMAVLASFSIAIVAVLLHKTVGLTSALIWSYLSLSNTYFAVMIRRAMGDSPLLFFIVMVTLLSYLYLNQSAFSKKVIIPRPYLMAIFIGVLVGLAQASKLNGVASIFGGFLVVSAIAVRMDTDRQKQLRYFLVSVLLLIFVSQLTFLLIYPTLWQMPLKITILMFKNRGLEMNIQVAANPQSAINGFIEHLKIVGLRVFQNYSTINFTGAFWINIPLCLLGLVRSIYEICSYVLRKPANSGLIAIFFIGGATALPSLATPLDWDRYYLLPVFFSTILIAVGAADVTQRLFRMIVVFVQKRKHSISE